MQCEQGHLRISAVVAYSPAGNVQEWCDGFGGPSPLTSKVAAPVNMPTNGAYGSGFLHSPQYLLLFYMWDGFFVFMYVCVLHVGLMSVEVKKERKGKGVGSCQTAARIGCKPSCGN